MTNILILPEESDSYRALSGDKESTGRTPGEALDALRSQLTDEEAGTLVIVQSHKPDRFFNAAQQKRLDELMRLRDAGELAAEDESELEELVGAELRGATERAESINDTARRGAYFLLHPSDSYERLKQATADSAEAVCRPYTQDEGAPREMFDAQSVQEFLERWEIVRVLLAGITKEQSQFFQMLLSGITAEEVAVLLEGTPETVRDGVQKLRARIIATTKHHADR